VSSYCCAGGGTPASPVTAGQGGTGEAGTGAGGGSMFASGVIQVTPQDKEAIERVSLSQTSTVLRYAGWLQIRGPVTFY
jgi:hypothetical protein